MFEKYTEKARRVIFFARYEASQFGSLAIEPEHLFLGLIREDHQFVNSCIRTSHISIDQIRNRIERGLTLREKISASVDLPLSVNARGVLEYAADESNLLQHSHIGTEHLLIGLLRQENTIACEILLEIGLSISGMRDEIKRRAEEIDAAVSTDRQSDLATLVRQMRALARAMMEKCDQIEDRINDLPPESSESG